MIETFPIKAGAAGKALFLVLALSGGVVAPCRADSPQQESSFQQPFFQAMDDVPLMPGLYETPDESVVFDKPDGRIADLYASSGMLSAEEIGAFYDQALRQTGWAPAGPGRFTRGGEVLTLEITMRNRENLVHFRIFPREKGRD